MPGIAEMALSGAPIAGGALLGMAAGSLRLPDLRGNIKADLELVSLLPAEDTERRTQLQRTIDMRIDDLVAGLDRNREIRDAVTSYHGNWRDIVVFACTVLFTVVWWNIDHTRSNWLITFVLLVILSTLAAIYAVRGLARGISTYRHLHGKRRSGQRAQ